MNAVEFEEEYVYQGRSYTIWSDVEYEVKGGFLRATRVDPAESIEISLLAVKVGGIELRQSPFNLEVCPILKEAIIGSYIDGFDFNREDLCNRIYDKEKEGDNE